MPTVPPGGSGPHAALLLAGLGLLLGIRHATDADHLVALSTIVSRTRSLRGAAAIGALWGIGHTATVFVVGSLIILFHVTVPARLGLGMEFAVAVMLVLLGLLNLTGLRAPVARLLAPRLPKLAPSGFLASLGRFFGPLHWLGYPHEHHPAEDTPLHPGRATLLRPFAIGLVHGLAGSTAIALLVLSTIRNPVWATVYLLVFGLGTILGMVGMTTAVALPLASRAGHVERLRTLLPAASGLVSLAFGLFLMYQLGIVGGLFTAHPHWTPE